MTTVSKYGYNETEHYLMIGFGLMSHTFMIPLLVMTYKQKKFHKTFIIGLTFFCSIMFRMIDALELDIMFLLEEEWCTLCNVGTMAGIWMLIIDLMDNRNPDADLQLQLTSIAIALIMQEKYPFDLRYTLIPMVLYVFVVICVLLRRKRMPQYSNVKMVRKGAFLLIGALVFFYYGLDNHKDYLRISNCLWKISMSLSAFYLLQAYNKNGTELRMIDVFKDKLHVE